MQLAESKDGGSVYADDLTVANRVATVAPAGSEFIMNSYLNGVLVPAVGPGKRVCHGKFCLLECRRWQTRPATISFEGVGHAGSEGILCRRAVGASHRRSGEKAHASVCCTGRSAFKAYCWAADWPARFVGPWKIRGPGLGSGVRRITLGPCATAAPHPLRCGSARSRRSNRRSRRSGSQRAVSGSAPARERTRRSHRRRSRSAAYR